MSAAHEIRQQISNHFYQVLHDNAHYYDAIEQLVLDGRTRFVLGIHELDELVPNISSQLLIKPTVYLAACEEGYQRLYESIYKSKVLELKTPCNYPPRLGIRDWLGSHTVTPRGLSSRLVNCSVCVQGIVTRCSLVRSKCTRSVHISEQQYQSVTLIRSHTDFTDLQKDVDFGGRPVPKTDKGGNLLIMEVGLSGFKDCQTITLQEMPEAAPSGQLPRAVDVILQEDLVDTVKPGDRICLWGIYKAVIYKDNHQSVSWFSRSLLLANHIEKVNESILAPELSPVDIQMIREIADSPNTFDLLASSIAPSICGHELIKKGLLLQLFGGGQKILENGMKLRGDIHILLIGDPSCGKSQLLRFMLRTAPLALSTTGRGSSGVGLTAAVTTDKDTKERRLDAGAMVLGDGGLVCIDEFDKMSTEDRVAIHEVMEQQTVSISKAGIHTTLNARTTVLAAANPVYGAFDPNLPFKSQIAFPDSLLTRFDLIYIIRDTQTSLEDRRICSQVIRQLQTVGETEKAKDWMTQSDEIVGILQPKATEFAQKRRDKTKYWDTKILPSASVSEELQVSKVLSVEFLQKYVYYAKHARPTPVLTDEAIESIASFYSNLRQNFASVGSTTSHRSHVLPSTRTLEACVRLATAHARTKLKSAIDKEDAEAAEMLLAYTLTGEDPDQFTKSNVKKLEPREPTARRKRLRQTLQSVSQGLKRRAPLPADASPTATETCTLSTQPIAFDSMQDDVEFATLSSSQAQISVPRLRLLKKEVSEFCQRWTQDCVAPSLLFQEINAALEEENRFEWTEFSAGIRELQSLNRIMLVNQEIWFI